MSRNGKNTSRTNHNQNCRSAKTRSDHVTKPSSSSSLSSSSLSLPSQVFIPHVPVLSSMIYCLSCLLPWKQLHQLNRLSRMSKAAIALSIAVVILSMFIHSQPADSTSGHTDSTRLCRTAGGVLANTPLCAPDQTQQSSDWRPPSENVWRKYGTDRCSIERVSVLDLSPERFEAEFRFKKCVIVTFPHGAADWTTPGNWSRRGLSESYSDMDIRSGQSLEIVRRGGHAKHVSTFSEYLDNYLMKERAENDTSEPT